MRKLARSAVIIAAALGASLYAIPVAHGNSFRVSERFVVHMWNPMRITMGGQTISCPVIIYGVLHSDDLDKTPGELLSWITRIIVTDHLCVNGRVRVLNEDLNWHRQYDSFIGELPEIAGLVSRTVGIRWSIDPTGALPACLAGTDVSDPAIDIAELDESGQITGVRFDETRTIDLGGSFLCEIAGSSRFAGTGSASAGDTSNAVTITLV